ncbi:MAG: sensor histidine kinase [Thermoanaerobaculia bacterium]
MSIVVTSSTTPIRPDYTPHARAERLIATGRAVLAVSSFIAVYLDPATPAKYQATTYTLLLIYTSYAAVAAVLAWRSAVPTARFRLISHVAELILFSLFVYLTEGPASPFFLYFVFSLFCATLRFSWRGILATAIFALTVYSAMAIVASFTSQSFDGSRVLVRTTYLGVISALLVYLGFYQQQLRTELVSLAAWPRELASRVDDVLRAMLTHAATVLNAQRVLLVWEETEEPWVYTALASRNEFRIDRTAPGAYDATGEIRNTSAFVRDESSSMLVYDPSHSKVSEREGDAIGAALRTAYDLRSAIVVSLESETLGARFIVPDVRTATGDDLALAHIVGRLVLATLEQFFFVQQVRQTASAEERLRISRELHDGIVQSLAGVGLRVHALRSKFDESSEVAEQLRHVQTVLEHDQRELRTIVRELRPHDTRDARTIVTQELQRMRERFPLEWGLEVEVENAVAPAGLTSRVAHELCRIVNESLSNAARHGGASRASVGVAKSNGHVEIRVRDNGRGFAFTGRHDLATLEKSGEGPRTLKERVRSLGGALVVDSSSSGATIEVSIPVQEEG